MIINYCALPPSSTYSILKLLHIEHGNVTLLFFPNDIPPIISLYAKMQYTEQKQEPSMYSHFFFFSVCSLHMVNYTSVNGVDYNLQVNSPLSSQSDFSQFSAKNRFREFFLLLLSLLRRLWYIYQYIYNNNNKQCSSMFESKSRTTFILHRVVSSFIILTLFMPKAT